MQQTPMELKEQQYNEEEPKESENINDIPQNYIPTNIPNYSPINSGTMNQNQITNTNTNQINNNSSNLSNAKANANAIEIISFFSWILLISCKWDSFKKSGIYNLKRMNGVKYRPLLYDTGFQDFIAIIICSLAFIIYVVNLLYKKNSKLYQSLFGQWSKYHFIPLILYSTMIMMVESAPNEYYKVIELLDLSNIISINNKKYRNLEQEISDSFSEKAFFAFFLIFGIFSLIAFIFIYLKTEMNCDWYAILTIKKGTYSVLIMEIWILIFDCIFRLRYIDAHNYEITEKDNEDILNDKFTHPEEALFKTGGIMFSLIIGLGAFIFAFVFKDIIILFINFVVYLGMILCFFGNQAYDEIIKDELNGNADGIIQIIIAVIDIILILFMVLFYKEKLIQS